MDTDQLPGPARPTETGTQYRHRFCWQELLDRALSGFVSTEQTLERIIDRMERAS